MRHWPVLLLVGAVELGTSCAPRTGDSSPAPSAAQQPRPFLGVPEDSTRKIEDENPDIDPRLHGVTTMTAVQPADYATYLRHKEGGKVAKEESRDGLLFFATEESVHVSLPAAGEAAGGAYIKVTNRFKAPLPKGN